MTGEVNDPSLEGQPLRHRFVAELEELQLQVEVMAARVHEAVRGARRVLEDNDAGIAGCVVRADDDIDAMAVSLTERCYDLLRREGPVASDLRLVVSVLRILEELERIGDLALRIVKCADDRPALAAHPDVLAVLVRMARVAEESFEIALDAWSSRRPERVRLLADRERVMDDHYRELTGRLFSVSGDDVAHVAITAVLVGRSLERISDHAVVIGERLGYVLTGDARYLASEVR